MDWILYHYHKIMKQLHKRPGAWQTGAFYRHLTKMREYERRLNDGSDSAAGPR